MVPFVDLMVYRRQSIANHSNDWSGDEVRTRDLQLSLYQLSYSPHTAPKPLRGRTCQTGFGM